MKTLLAILLVGSPLLAQSQTSQSDAEAIRKAAIEANKIPPAAATIENAATAAKKIPPAATDIGTAAGAITNAATSIGASAGKSNTAASNIDDAATKVEKIANRLDRQAERVHAALDHQGSARDFILAPHEILPGRTMYADVICADYISREECLRQAAKASPYVKRQGGNDFVKANFTPRLGIGKPAECGAVQSGADPEGLRAARLAAKTGAPPPTPAPKHSGPVLTYCFERKLDSGDQIQLRTGSPDPETLTVQDPPIEEFLDPEPAPEPPFAPEPPAEEGVAPPEPANPDPVPISEPKDGATIAGKDVKVVATAKSGSSVTAIEFWLDGKKAGDFVQGSGLTFTFTFDSTTKKNNQYTFATVARDKDGLSSPQSSIKVTVQNPILSEIRDLEAKPTSPTAATVTWTTDQPGTTAIALSPPTVKIAPDTEKKTSHSVSLSGLSPWTAYDVTATSTDDAQGVTLNKKVAFKTPALILTTPHDKDTITGTQTITATGIDKAGVTVQFLIDGQNFEAAVNGTNGSYSVPWDTTKADNGSHPISASASNGSETSDPAKILNVTVKNIPVLTNIVVNVTSTTDATITWTTPKQSDSQILFGKTTAYTLQSALVADAVEAHAISLTGLDPSTTYHFQAKSKDPQGNVGTSSDAVLVTWATAPTDVDQLTEGTTKVVGYYNQGAADKVRVKVLDGNNTNQHQEQKDQAVTDKRFNVSLDQPLSSEAQVIIIGLNADGKEGDSRTFRVATSVMDWGRVRAYFTFGMVLSANEVSSGASGNANNAFSTTNASPFIAFNIDKNWLRPRSKAQRIRVNTYFDARLTQIATAAAGTQTGTAAGGATQNTTVAFLANKQAGSLQGGFYIPIILARWDTRHSPNSLYIAPLAKAGLYTTSDNLGTSAARLSSGTSFYNFQGYGVRIGHYKEYQRWNGDLNTDRAPEQLSYMDILAGRWGNFESVSPMTKGTGAADLNRCNTFSSDPATADCFLRQRLYRIGIEGILQIPHTPFIIGMNANIGFQHPKALSSKLVQELGVKSAPVGYNFIEPPDDLRFLIGARFNAKSLLGPIIKAVSGSVGQ